MGKEADGTAEVPYETERKFLVRDQSVLDGHSGERIDQGYFPANDGFVLRIRTRTIVQSDGNTYPGLSELTLKGPKRGSTRAEYETRIEDLDFAMALLSKTSVRITKTRYPIIDRGQTWDVDVFHGENDGLIVAELEREDAHTVKDLPDWCGEEVTYDHRYNNENLAERPTSGW